ncbi:hypothetical protein, partial [Frankia sp. AgKG'84/4]|uniref:hypothetical protein n=1 Tax=Frankia sp. AgKG'84/4 TaxID=573490 RepID=UPI002029FC63
MGVTEGDSGQERDDVITQGGRHATATSEVLVTSRPRGPGEGVATVWVATVWVATVWVATDGRTARRGGARRRRWRGRLFPRRIGLDGDRSRGRPAGWLGVTGTDRLAVGAIPGAGRLDP